MSGWYRIRVAVSANNVDEDQMSGDWDGEDGQEDEVDDELDIKLRRRPHAAAVERTRDVADVGCCGQSDHVKWWRLLFRVGPLSAS